MELLELHADRIEFEVECSKGTYIRVLGEEIAAALGTEGHLCELRRLWVEPFDPQAMVTLATIEEWVAGRPCDADRPAWLLPTDAALVGLPRLDFDGAQSLHLCQGRVVAVAGDRPAGLTGLIRAYDPAGRFLGLVEPASGAAVRVVRLFVPGADGPGAASA
jgi:tRNA pseudouridine55 synthase